MPPELTSRRPAVLVQGAITRALIRELSPTAWSVLLDVSLDARVEENGWVAATSVRRIAGHLGLTPGTVARALARLSAAGLVRRDDRRDRATGRFVESVYVVVPTSAVQPCVDCPHTAGPDTAAPLLTGDDALYGDAGQGLPEGMASVCRPFSAGGPLGQGSGLAMEAGSTGDRRGGDRGLALFGPEWQSC